MSVVVVIAIVTTQRSQVLAALTGDLRAVACSVERMQEDRVCPDEGRHIRWHQASHETWTTDLRAREEVLWAHSCSLEQARM